MKPKIAYFISPHGFGHAARSAAIMESINSLNKIIEFEIFTKVPPWFYTNSGINNFNYHDLLTDIGLVQKTALKENLDETISELNEFIPFKNSTINKISKKLIDLGCKLILCDISPLGLEIASRANIPSVLIENFTWDWIYTQYNRTDAQLNKHIAYLTNIYEKAKYHIKTRPICFESSSDLLTNPISRKPINDDIEIRKKLGISTEQKIIMITMGGIPTKYEFYSKLADYKDITFIIPGSTNILEKRNNLVLLPHRSEFFHPDLIKASDAVIGKVGYSTLAEVYNSGNPFGYIIRSHFPESEPLSAFINSEMKGIEITEDEFNSGKWVRIINELLSFPKIHRTKKNGACQAAEFINNLI